MPFNNSIFALNVFGNKMVSRDVLKQVMWERDLAISQLAEINKGLGSKMDGDIK